MNKLVTSVNAACASIQHHYSGSTSSSTRVKIDSAIILGSGLSNLNLDGFETVCTINYSDISGLPKATAPSHKGELKLISNGQRTLALCAGRHHLYEGHSAQDVATLAYVMRQLGADELIITNAAGALNPDYQPGDIMLINDHINFTGHNPVRAQDDTFGVVFPDMSKAYDVKRLSTAKSIAATHSIACHQGVYIGVMGPSLETSAERRMMRSFGADAVGMSTVLEVIAANHCGMEVLGMSAITNLALGDENQAPDTLEEVLENAAIAGKGMVTILNGLFAS